MAKSNPAGYEEVNLDFEGGATVNWDAMPEVEGVVKKCKSEVGKNKSRVLIVTHSDGKDYTVWETARLQNLFGAAAEGDSVKIVYQGMRKNPVTGRREHDFKAFLRKAS